MEAGIVPTPLPKPSRDDRDDVVILRDTPWALYEAILAARGGKRVPRLQYASGRLELMSPGRSHERIHTLFGRLVEAYADECDIALDGYGSWTLKDEAVARGVEADECYVLGDPEADRPDLAIEVIWTSGGLDKLDLYAPLRVREVWFWEEGRISVHVLRGGAYVEAPRSEVLPGIDLALLARFVARTDQSAAVREYRAALRASQDR
ncbi:MAG: Uma2 family endonuclease [Polyangiales bacterium]